MDFYELYQYPVLIAVIIYLQAKTHGQLSNDNSRVCYIISSEVRKVILKSLLELNHKICEEEIKQGLHKKKCLLIPNNVNYCAVKPKTKKLHRRGAEKEAATGDLFGG